MEIKLETILNRNLKNQNVTELKRKPQWKLIRIPTRSVRKGQLICLRLNLNVL